MYATSADWKVNDGTWSEEQEKTMTAKMKSLGALHFILLQRASHRQYCALMATHGTSSKASGTSSSQEGTGEGWGRRVTRETRKSKRNSHELKDSANFFSRTGEHLRDVTLPTQRCAVC